VEKDKAKITINACANIVGKAITVFSIYIFIPLYIKFLGEESYGLVGFFATLQAALALLGGGFSNSIRREFASGEDNNENRLRKYQLLRSVEALFFLIGMFIILLVWLGTDFIVYQWLKGNSISPDVIKTSIRMMGISIGMHICSNLYTGGLLGLEKHVTFNIIQSIFKLFKGFGAVMVLWLVMPDIRLFLLWNILVDAINLAVIRSVVISALKSDVGLYWNIKLIGNIKSILSYTVGVFFIAIFATINSQLDKVLVSKFLTLAQLGIYSVAFSISQIPTLITTSIVNAIFPTFTYYYSVNEVEKLKTSFKNYYNIFLIFSISIGFFMAFYMKDLLTVWIRNSSVVEQAYIAAIILVLGNTILSLQVIPDNYLLACKNTKIINLRNLLTTPLMFIVMPLLIIKFELIGAAFSYFVITLIGTVFYNNYIYFNFIDKNIPAWIFKYNIIPALIALLMAGISFLINMSLKLSSVFSIILAILSGSLTLLLLLYLYVPDIIMVIYKKVRVLRWFNTL